MGIALSLAIWTKRSRQIGHRNRETTRNGRITMPVTQYRRRPRRRRRRVDDDDDDQIEFRHCLSFSKIKGPMGRTYTLFIYGGQCLLILGVLMTIGGFSSGHDSGDSSQVAESRALRIVGPLMATVGLCMCASGCSVHKRSVQLTDRIHANSGLSEYETFDPSSSKDVYFQLACASGFMLFLIGICFTAIGFSVRKYSDTGVEYMKYFGPVFMGLGLLMNISSGLYMKYKKQSRHRGGCARNTSASPATESRHPPGSDSDSDVTGMGTPGNMGYTERIDVERGIWNTNFDFSTRGPPQIIKPPPYQEIAGPSPGHSIQEPPPEYSRSSPGETLPNNNSLPVLNAGANNNTNQPITNTDISHRIPESSDPPFPPNYHFVSENSNNSDLPPPPSYEVATSNNQRSRSMPDVC